MFYHIKFKQKDYSYYLSFDLFEQAILSFYIHVSSCFPNMNKYL